MIGHTNKQTNREYYFIYIDIQYLLKDYVGAFKHSKLYRTYLHDLYVNKNRGFQKPLSQRWLFGLVCTNFKYFSKKNPKLFEDFLNASIKRNSK